jgi:peptidoglycan-associated lipoprotein
MWAIEYSTQPDIGPFVTTPPEERDARADFLADFAATIGDRNNVYFAFDSSVIDASAQGTIRLWAEFLARYPDVPVVIEGHCDERGSREYNLALGERRAEAAASLLIALGIDAARVSTVSYGKERPAVEGHNEEAWSFNRRATLVPG